jgi:ribA/ribD-fused uncharacterized protein
MMAMKAHLFDDKEKENNILKETEPRLIKKFGSAVKPFNDELWAQVSYNVVCVGNFAKFSQNEDLRAFLLSTGDMILVEASPTDCIWGIGLSKKDAENTDPKKWLGSNLLGKALMDVRDAIFAGESEEEFLRKHQINGDDISKWTCTYRARNAIPNPNPETSKVFMKKVQSIVESVQSGKGSATIEEQELLNEFDKRYRSFVYRKLIKDSEKGGRYGFKMVDNGNIMEPVSGDIRGAEVFAGVWAKLFGIRYELVEKPKKESLSASLLNFDFDSDRVGKGAFRKYLDSVINSVVAELRTRDLIIEKDVHGNKMYDYSHGKRKARYVSKHLTVNDENDLDRSLMRAKSELQDDKKRAARMKMLLEVSYLAYYWLKKGGKIGPEWFKEAAERIFERGESSSSVKEDVLQRDGDARRKPPSGSAFDKELSTLRSRIRKLSDKMIKEVYAFNDINVGSAKDAKSHTLDPKEVLDKYWEDLALYIGDKKMHDIRYNIVRGIVEAEVKRSKK